ncbi:MAG: GNAT family N-acetyltransferase [Cyanobium sp.]|jgi:GNAT superfamily N-acetyltransferase
MICWVFFKRCSLCRSLANTDMNLTHLMLIVPEARSTGIGKRAVAAIERTVESVEACSETELAVLKVNVRGLHFWTAQGFCHRRNAAGDHFGQRRPERWISGKSLRAT